MNGTTLALSGHGRSRAQGVRMSSEQFISSPRRRKIARAPLEEIANRDGHWTREFTSRLEAWPIVEPWVSEAEFHMIAAKGKRRLYLKESGPFFRTIVDIKQYESQITVSAWVEVKFLARLMTLFLLPAEMFPNPSGILGVRPRRKACRDLNNLLDRFRQAPILGSDSFHLADLDLTTLMLLGVMVIPFLVFAIGSLATFEVFPGLSNSLLVSIGKQLGALAVGCGVLLGVHHFVVVKRFEEMVVKAASAGVTFVAFLVLSIVLLTRTSTEMLETRFVHHCISHYQEVQCQRALENLPLRSRGEVGSKLQVLQKHLTLKPRNE